MAPKRPHEGGQEQSGQARKKQKTIAARTIQLQGGASAGAGIITNGLAGLPSTLDVEKFTEARSFEITAMQSAMETAKGGSTQRAWQTLPRALRRRAASHDVRRVPARLRGKARAEMDPMKRSSLRKKLPKKGKSKLISRTQDFLKRQRNKTWLETHIWHAKRMHMKNLWGYRLAETSTEKSYRSSHRSAVHSSILHDASYTSTISVAGKQYLLEKLLIRCCDCQGASPASIRYTLGSRIHETHIYQPGEYPLGLIAPVQILWKPLAPTASPPNPGTGETSTSANSNTQAQPKRRRRGKAKEDTNTPNTPTTTVPDPHTRRTIWIRFHPSAWQEIWDAIQVAASWILETVRQSQRSRMEMGDDTSKENRERSKDIITDSAHGSTEPEESIELIDLRSQVNCFELMGPRSTQVLLGALTLVRGDEREIFKQFWNQLRELQTPGSVPRGMIIGMKVHDPRLNFPPKNAKIATKTDGGLPSTGLSSTFTVYPNTTLARSELWEGVERDGGYQKPKFKKKDLDERRRQNLIPGTPLQPFRQDDRIPLMLIQRTAAPLPSKFSRESKDPESIYGWTLLLPPNWSMPFFNSLTHTGTRVGGLRERRTQVFEAGSLDFPFDYPLTSAYNREESAQEKEEREQWERKPPAKRVKWESVGTRSPWRADWEAVLGFQPQTVLDEGLLGVQRTQEEEGMSDDINGGGRDASRSMWLLRGSDTPGIVLDAANSDDPATSLFAKVNSLRVKAALDPLTMDAPTLLKGALVPVKLHMCSRGSPGHLAAIYEVDKQERDRLVAMLAQKKRRHCIEDADPEPSTLVPEESHIIGYITTGKYSLLRGRGYAIGTVSAARLIDMVAADSTPSYPRLVKIKNRESSVCRVASLEILT